MLLPLLLACASSSPPAKPPETAPVASSVASDCPAAVYGALPADLGPAVDADQLRTGQVESGSRVLVRGVIKEVCQKKGCWHTLATADPAVDILVKDKEYAIFLPTGCGGRTAEIAGTFTREVMPLEEARHYAEDAGEDPSTITEAPVKLLIDVEGVAIR